MTRWRGRVAGACAWLAASLPAAAMAQPAGGVVPGPSVLVHFDAPRPGISLFELDPHAPAYADTRRLCEGPCNVRVMPAGRKYFYDGEGIAVSERFKLDEWPPVVTVHAEPRSLAMRGAGVGTIVTGALAFPAGMLLFWAGFGGSSAMVYSGIAAFPLGGVLIGVGVGLLRYGKSPVRVETSAPPSVSFRVGPTGPALVF